MSSDVKGQCVVCGSWRNRSFGRWCWDCYCEIVDAAPCRQFDFSRERETRIAKYAELAAKNDPLFEGR